MAASSSCFVLIRGLMRQQRHWRKFTSILQNQFPDANIITLDIPGNGSLHHQTSPSNITGFTDALRQQLPDRSNLNLIGLSMGGMIAIDWMNRYPLEIKSAVLINTSVRSYSPFFQRLRWRSYPKIVSMLLGSTEQLEQQILSLTSNRHSNNKKLLKTWLQWRQQNPVSRKSAINQFLAAATFSIQTKPAHPLLIVGARNDRLVDFRCSLKLRQVWHTDYQQHDWAGHDLPLDDPQWLAQVIYRWIITQ